MPSIDTDIKLFPYEQARLAELNPEGWFRTGDVAKVQKDGFVKICDRLNDMILLSGNPERRAQSSWTCPQRPTPACCVMSMDPLTSTTLDLASRPSVSLLSGPMSL